MKNVLKALLRPLINVVFRIFPIQKKTILFGPGDVAGHLNESPRAIYDYINSKHKGEYRTVWYTVPGADTSGVPKKDIVIWGSLKSYYYFATAKYQLESQGWDRYLYKRKKQVYIQFWHGNGGTGKINTSYYLSPDKKLHNIQDWDWYIGMSNIESDLFIKTYHFKGKNVVLGNAKTDYLVNMTEEKKNRIKKDLGIDPKKKIVLYAPTWRTKNADKKDFKGDFLINSLTKLPNTQVVVKLHPNSVTHMPKNLFSDKIVNANRYNNIADLMAVADTMVVDYSSVMFLYSLFKKPMIFYIYDYEAFVNENETFGIDLTKELPGPIAKNEKELYSAVKKLWDHYHDYDKVIDKWNKLYHPYDDGKVCERFYNKLKEGYFDEK